MADETTTTGDAEGADTATDATTDTTTTDAGASESITPEEAARIRAALAKANKEAETFRLKLKAVDDEKLSEIEKAKRDAAEASQELEKLRRDSIRQKVALDAGLPAKWVARLQGDSEEELVADAAEILADLNKSRKPAPDASQGARTNALSEDDQLYERLYGKKA